MMSSVILRTKPEPVAYCTDEDCAWFGPVEDCIYRPYAKEVPLCLYCEEPVDVNYE